MLKRLYVHNYKCLVNFEINFDQDISLFLGANGSGKSTVFEVLNKLKQFFNGNDINDLFNPRKDIPRWLEHRIFSTELHFELDAEYYNNFYKYKLKIIFLEQKYHIKEESLYKGDEIVFLAKDGKVNEKINNWKSDFDPFFSMLAGDDSHWISDTLNNLFIINPYKHIEWDSVNSIYDKNFNVLNYKDWFFHLNEKNRKRLKHFEEVLPNILLGFEDFKINVTGVPQLQLDFIGSTKNSIVSYDFEELSDGQKSLLLLYTVIYCTPDNSIICIDEPENFLALPEIQPWFDALYDQCAERNLQALLISHHPKIINLLASDSGYWFSRDNNLTRIQKITPEDESGLSIAELIERGWIYEH